jgi:pimeloyl-ACP methyl ester carboxylesterase
MAVYPAKPSRRLFYSLSRPRLGRRVERVTQKRRRHLHLRQRMFRSNHRLSLPMKSAFSRCWLRLAPVVLIFDLAWSQVPPSPAPAASSPPPARRGGPRGPEQPMAGEHRIIARGDLELLTYETEEDVRQLDELLARDQSAAPQPGEFVMRYLRSRTDGSVQPYGLWLPPGYTSGKKFALLVQLHGIGPKTLAGRRTTWRGMGVKEWIDPHAPVIVAHPMGRGNTFYQGMGEEDVLEVAAEVQRRFSVDPDRVFIMGHSMGGAGSYTVGLHFPDRFGSITPIDAAMWSQEEGADALPAWARPQFAIVRPANLFPNARNVPVYFKNAGAGIQRNSTAWTDGIVEQGGFSTAESFPGMPHHFAPQMSYAMFTGQATLLPIRGQPPEVKLYTNTLRYNQAYWVTVDRLTQHNRDASITAKYDDGKPPPAPARRGAPPAPPAAPRPPSLAVTTANVDSLTLRLADAGVPAGSPLPFKVDGAEISSGPLPAVVHLAKQAGGWRLTNSPAVDSAGKRHGVQGPIGDALNGRFLAVYGEGDRDLAVAELNAIRNPPGSTVIHGETPMKAAAKVTADDITNCHLLLFGTPASNPVLRRLASRLPAKLLSPPGPAAGVIFIHPNPENPNRYVVVWTTRVLSRPDNGLRLGFIQPINLLPDYALLEDGKIRTAGFFDNLWHLQDTRVEWAEEPGHRASRARRFRRRQGLERLPHQGRRSGAALIQEREGRLPLTTLTGPDTVMPHELSARADN